MCLTSNMLVTCASEHRVHGVTHFVEEVLHHGWCEESRCTLGRMREVQHEHHHWQLVLAIFQPSSSTDSEMAVLGKHKCMVKFFTLTW